MKTVIKIVVLLGLLAGVSPACIWDSDTVDDEIHGLPEHERLLAGRWYRHGVRRR